MAWANVGDWIYFTGGRDYIIKWDHKKTGQTIELEPSEGQENAEWGKLDWEVQWSDDKGNVEYLGDWPEKLAFTVAGRVMERYPNGVGEKDRDSLMQVGEQIAAGIKAEIQQRRVGRKLEVRKRKLGQKPRLSR